MLGYKYDQCSRWHIFALKKTRASGRNVGKVFNPVVKLVLENQPFLMPEPAEKPSLQKCLNWTKYKKGIAEDIAVDYLLVFVGLSLL